MKMNRPPLRPRFQPTRVGLTLGAPILLGLSVILLTGLVAVERSACAAQASSDPTATAQRAPVHEPTPPANPQPVMNSGRTRGFITGDLEGDEGLVLLVAGIVAGLVGLSKRWSGPARLTVFLLAMVRIDSPSSFV